MRRLLLLLAFVALPAHAVYPEKPIRFIIPSVVWSIFVLSVLSSASSSSGVEAELPNSPFCSASRLHATLPTMIMPAKSVETARTAPTSSPERLLAEFRVAFILCLTSSGRNRRLSRVREEVNKHEPCRPLL